LAFVCSDLYLILIAFEFSLTVLGEFVRMIVCCFPTAGFLSAGAATGAATGKVRLLLIFDIVVECEAAIMHIRDEGILFCFVLFCSVLFCSVLLSSLIVLIIFRPP
jgi:hypothetical protein